MRTFTLAVALLLAACGTEEAPGGTGAGGSGGSGADPDAACERDLAAFTPCGGDPTGSWSARAACMEGDFSAGVRETLGQYPACADAPVDVASDMSGTLRFGEDGSHESALLLDLRITILLDDACLREVSRGAPVGPSQVCALTDGQTAGDSTLDCSYGPGGCSCAVVMSRPLEGSSTFEVRGNNLAIPADGTSEAGFCVRDELLQLQLAGDAMGPVQSGLLVLERE